LALIENKFISNRLESVY